MNDPAVGIDLGTTFSVIAHLDSAGRPWTIPNAEGDLITPSVVFFDGSVVIVGKEAQKAAVAAPEEIAQFVKRDMGCKAYEKAINGEHLPPEVIQSYILDKLRRDATLKLGNSPRSSSRSPPSSTNPAVKPRRTPVPWRGLRSSTSSTSRPQRPSPSAFSKVFCRPKENREAKNEFSSTTSVEGRSMPH